VSFPSLFEKGTAGVAGVAGVVGDARELQVQSPKVNKEAVKRGRDGFSLTS